MSKKYTITLTDSRKIESLEFYKSYFRTEENLDKSIFSNNLRNVIVSDGENSETIPEMELITIFRENDITSFMLRKLSPKEIEQKVMLTNIGSELARAKVDIIQKDNIIKALGMELAKTKVELIGLENIVKNLSKGGEE